MALDEALAAFALVAPRQAKVVELRYFGGLNEEEIVAVLKDLSADGPAGRDWEFARAWLMSELKLLGTRVPFLNYDPKRIETPTCGRKTPQTLPSGPAILLCPG